MKKSFIFSLVMIAIIGCSKDNPTESSTPTIDSIPSIVTANIESNLSIYSWFSSLDSGRGVYVDFEITGKYKNYDKIKLDSDSLYGFVYLDNGRVLQMLQVPTTGTPDTTNHALYVVNDEVIFDSEMPGSVLITSDSLAAIDSSTAYFIWWYNNERQWLKYKTLSSVKY
jgi:hypothetical protein